MQELPEDEAVTPINDEKIDDGDDEAMDDKVEQSTVVANM